MSGPNPLLVPMKGTQRREVGGVQLDIAPAGAARVERLIYPPGYRWSKHMKPLTGTDYACTRTPDFWPRGNPH